MFHYNISSRNKYSRDAANTAPAINYVMIKINLTGHLPIVFAAMVKEW